jgi:outer membrane immunogenic protein
MKQLIRLTILLCTCAVFALTVAAGPESLPSSKEMKQVAPAPPTCDFSWTGFYIGANGGYGWGSADTHFDPLPDAATFFDLEPTSLEPDPDGFIGGGQLGYNFQWNWLILGVEADFQGSDMEGSGTSSPIINITGGPERPGSFLVAHERTQWFGTARARMGFAPFCRLMVYATGGLAYGNVDYSANANFDNGFTYPVSFSKTKAGWTVGGGLEYALSHHWSVRAEYLYYDLGDESRTGQELFNGVPTGSPTYFVHYNLETTANIVRGGLNFKF